VSALADAIGRRLGWNDEQLRSLQMGGTLHDVGKLSVPGRILRKPGPLTPEELAEIRTHPEAGARLIEPIESAHVALACVLHHHERWDGSGYPHRLAGPAIPLDARVLAVADAFDAMTSHRPYRRALSDEDALAEIERCSGTQFDPDVVRAFLDMWAAGPIRLPEAS
jgi:HD-GYP domain-containing protein (c-di-GMP phosphodiesterase class II)